MALNNKNRSGDKFIQTDKYLSILKRFNIPSSISDTLEAEGSPYTILFNKTTNSLRIFNGTSWIDANQTDLSLYYTKDEVDIIIDIVTDINDSQQLQINNLQGMQLIADQAAQEFKLVDATGNIMSTLSVAFLNNEGTTFIYNDETGNLELWNDQDELLSEIPVSAFVGNLATTLGFNGIKKNQLELQTDEGYVLGTVQFNIINVGGLQSALDNKENSFTILPVSKGGTSLSTIGNNNFIVGGPGNTYQEKTPAQIRTLIGAQQAGDYIEEEQDPTVPQHVKDITEGDITNWNTEHNPITLGTQKNGLLLTDQELQLKLATITESGAMSSADKTKINNINIYNKQPKITSLDGINYYLTKNYISGTCQIFRNGIEQTITDDYIENGNNHIIFVIPVIITGINPENININYESNT